MPLPLRPSVFPVVQALFCNHGVDHERGLTTEYENWRHPEAPRFFQRGEGSP